MSGKDLPPANGTDIQELLRRRHANTNDDGPQQPPAAPAAPLARREAPAMDRRSWYMSRTAADALAEAVSDLHFDTRLPKHVVLEELVQVAMDHVREVRERLEKRASHS